MRNHSSCFRNLIFIGPLPYRALTLKISVIDLLRSAVSIGVVSGHSITLQLLVRLECPSNPAKFISAVRDLHAERAGPLSEPCPSLKRA